MRREKKRSHFCTVEGTLRTTHHYDDTPARLRFGGEDDKVGVEVLFTHRLGIWRDVQIIVPTP